MSAALFLVLLFAGVLVIGGMAASLSSKNSLKQRVENRRMEENAVRSAKALVLVAGIFGFFVARVWFEKLAASNPRQWSDIPGGGTTFGILVALLMFAFGSFIFERWKR